MMDDLAAAADRAESSIFRRHSATNAQPLLQPLIGQCITMLLPAGVTFGATDLFVVGIQCLAAGQAKMVLPAVLDAFHIDNIVFVPAVCAAHMTVGGFPTDKASVFFFAAVQECPSLGLDALLAIAFHAVGAVVVNSEFLEWQPFFTRRTPLEAVDDCRPA
jgi:hypothetical protein